MREWLIIIVLATALAWRFRPGSWPSLPRARFSLRWLMVVVLVLGLICGGLARWYARHARRQALLGELRAQQQVTETAIHGARADLQAAGRKVSSLLFQDSFSPDVWKERVDAYEGPDGRKMPLIFVEVSGGRDEDLLRPITIKNSGASEERPILDRLIRAYRVRGWTHQVVPPSVAGR